MAQKPVLRGEVGCACVALKLKLCEPHKLLIIRDHTKLQIGPIKVRVKSGYFCPKPVLGYNFGIS